MDQQKFSDPEEMITCPYEQVHQVTRKRMTTHLEKCRRQHLELSKVMKTCPYNFTHKVAAPELEFHEEVCTDRETYYSHAFQIGGQTTATLEELTKNTEVKLELPCTESWDIDTDFRGTDVLAVIEKTAESRGVLRNYSNMAPAERKAKREKDRQKMIERNNKEELAKADQSLKFSSPVVPNTGSSIARYAESSAAHSSAASVLSDSSFNTALDTTNSRLNDFQIVEKKKGRGRAAKILSTTSTSLAGVGRGRARTKREEKIEKSAD